MEPINIQELQKLYPNGGRILCTMNPQGEHGHLANVDDGVCELEEVKMDKRGNTPCTAIEVQFSGLVECTIDGKRVDPGLHRGMPMGEHTVRFVVPDDNDYIKAKKLAPVLPVCPFDHTPVCGFLLYASFKPLEENI